MRSYLSRLSIYSMGWEPDIVLPSDMRSINDIVDKPFIACLSHTTIWEFFLWIFYRNSYDILDEYPPVLLTNGKLVDKYPWITKKMECFPIYRDQKDNYSKILEYIKNNKTRIVIVAPSGEATKPKPWKTGYYNIAKELGWDMRVIGFDFVKKQLIVGKAVSYKLPLNITQQRLQKDMAKIVPLYPKNSYVPVKYYRGVPSRPSLFLLISVSMLIFFLTVLFIILSLKNIKW